MAVIRPVDWLVGWFIGYCLVESPCFDFAKKEKIGVTLALHSVT